MIDSLKRSAVAAANALTTIWDNFLDRTFPRSLKIVEGDSLPSKIPRRDLVLARDGEEDWCVGMRCPCHCGRTVELLLIPEAAPRWSLSVNSRGAPTLSPSVWLVGGCASHFWVRDGKVVWC